jgi:chemotaxis-related protein WspB
MTLFLQTQIGNEGYLLEAAGVVCVLPLVDIRHIPRAPTGVVGCFSYRGTPVPVIDLTELALGRPAPRHLSTRVILVALGGSDERTGQRERLLGLIAEKVTDTIRRDAADFSPTGITSDSAAYLGPVTTVGGRLLQWVEVSSLLPREVSEALFRHVGQDIGRGT